MIGDVIYTPPKNKYPQYRRSDFDQLTYAGMLANYRQFVIGYDNRAFYEVMSKYGENQLNINVGRL